MNRTNIRGSITVEAIVMLGLVATLTPILYKHVAERRQDIDNINEANTLLLLKNATREYIEANKNSLTTGTVVLNPADIGVNISGYQIGIRKDSDGNIDAMITGKAGTDLKAGKVASLLGVSAGIYSAQDSARAWGINGVWAENISNYGFSSLPTGIPVITTAYDKEENADVSEALNIDEIIAGLGNISFDKLQANTICLNEPEGEVCLSKWSDIADLDAFKDAMKEGETCQSHADCGSSGNLLCLKPSGNTTGSCQNPLDVIEKCTKGNNLMCATGYSASLNQNCDQIRKTYTMMSKDPLLDSEVRHRISTSASGGYLDVSCYFPSGSYLNNNKMGYTNLKNGTTNGNVGLLNACNDSDSNACRTALRVGANIYFCSGWKSYGFSSGQYKTFFDGRPWDSGGKNNCDMGLNGLTMLSGGSYTILWQGSYVLAVKATAGNVAGRQNLSSGQRITNAYIAGGSLSSCTEYWCSAGSPGYAYNIDGRVALVAGGRGGAMRYEGGGSYNGRTGGGGGYVGGIGQGNGNGASYGGSGAGNPPYGLWGMWGYCCIYAGNGSSVVLMSSAVGFPSYNAGTWTVWIDGEPTSGWVRPAIP